MEVIEKVEILENDQLIVVLASGGKPDYQYIYREAAEVNWDDELKAFKSPAPREWSHSDWFHHIVKVAKNFSINLVLNNDTTWVNISNNIKEQILVGKNT
ncbi:MULTISPECIES: hypothetical protein [unclassified Colwellia]|jgi:hypothetical protein|uniref:hypothetical protein n=1 Tax=unclassified Colwellia TaxID=196834 RepID=UPI0015F65052|nr:MULTISPECIES: hypothetical protein [unclassified Colwellia]MBA6254452.1 hypothetical protein [Colwellia sp. MB3u-28]MBA6259184.1 hypothetical protein [Colwellia sp. MB3u-41]